jgi:drug/metabolite transporter (DMT)-like permease
MVGIALLVAVTIFYAGYNVLIKVSGTYVPASATTTIVATICVQVAALCTSVLFLGAISFRGGQVFALSWASYFWAALAGLCIGAAEIGYFYLFGGIGLARPMAASVAIPTIVSGTVVIALLFSALVLGETIAWNQVLGSALIVLGIATVFLGRTGLPS